MNLIREVISDQTVTALASIVLIVAALPMAGWSWAVNQMAGRKKEPLNVLNARTIASAIWNIIDKRVV